MAQVDVGTAEEVGSHSRGEEVVVRHSGREVGIRECWTGGEVGNVGRRE